VRFPEFQIQPAVTFQNVVICAEAQQARRAVDPTRCAFELDKKTDRRLVERNCAASARLLEFGAEFFVAKHLREAQPLQNGHQEFAVRDLDFEFLARFVAPAGVGAFVREFEDAARFPDAQQSACAAKREIRRVVDEIALEDAQARNTESGLPEFAASLGGVWDTKLDFNFASGMRAFHCPAV